MYTPRSPDLSCTCDTNVYIQARVNAPMYSVNFVGHMLNITNSPVQNTFAKCKPTNYSNIVNRYMHLATCVQNLPVSLPWVRPVCQTALWVECKAVACFLSPPTLRICHVQRVKQPVCWSIPVAQAQSLVCDAIVQNLNLSQVYNVHCAVCTVHCEPKTQWVKCAAGCVPSSLFQAALPMFKNV